MRIGRVRNVVVNKTQKDMCNMGNKKKSIVQNAKQSITLNYVSISGCYSINIRNSTEVVFYHPEMDKITTEIVPYGIYLRLCHGWELIGIFSGKYKEGEF